MAEFKLGRIRFVWQGEWTTGHTYYKDDVVRLGGKTYICVVGHTAAADFYTDLDVVPTRWEQMSDGQSWKGDWDTDTFYSINDVVKYGGLLYIANDSHTSAATITLGLEANSADWDLYAEGFDWKGAWTTSTRYKKNDLVKYGGYTYVCNAHHTSAATESLGLETDLASWDIFNQGIEYKAAWVASTRYKVNDVVKYGASLWICTTQHTSSLAFGSDSSTKWSLFVDGIQYEDEWSSSTVYQPGDIVAYGGNQYIAKTIHSNSSPGAGDSSLNWTLFTEGFKFQSDWDSATTYKIGEVVRLRGYTYLCLTENVNHEPPNTAYWTRLTSGIQWQGEWVDDVYYKLGDAIRYGSNAYICVLAHRSEGDDGSTITAEGGGAANSRPDQDITGTYWNLLSSGSETSVLTTRGDLVYFGGAGPTRLPVGLEGQVLRAGALDPEWTSWGSVDHVYYVAPHGVDAAAPINGITLDKPWKSIRYACQQVEKGCRNPNAARLLEMNRVFIQREVTKWIEYQIDYYTNTVPTPGNKWYNFDYDEYKCERDVGFIVDRVIWDITHGGNLKMRAAAQTYLNALSEGPYSTEEAGTGLYTKIATEGDNDVEAFNYMLTLVEDVLGNQAPAVNYQSEMGDTSTATVSQYIDTTYTAEAGIMTTITSLVGIITTALTDGNTTNLPARIVPSNVIAVKAGTYYETLPIIVPAETAILGDEVRAVHVSPAPSLIDISDSQYSVASLTRLQEVVTDVIQGNSVTVSVGNTATQNIAWPYAGSIESDDANKLLRVAQYNIDFRLGTTHTISNTDPTDYNTAYLSTYGNARTLISANKDFFKAEVQAWIDANYPDLKYSRTSCLRDVGYIVDSMVYDLTYGGNSQSVQAGLAYYQGVGSSLYIDSTEKTATLGAYARLKLLMQSVVVGTLATPLQTAVVQNTSGTAGSAATATFVGANMDTMIAIVTDGPSAVYTLTDPSTSWVSSSLTTAYSTLNSAVSTIQTNTIDYINSNFGNFTYNSALCRRDLGYLVDAAYYDAAFGSNFWAVQNGLSYRRRQASVVLTQQLDQELGAINYLKTLAATSLASSATAVTRSNAAYTEIIDIINNGAASADALTFTDTGTANYTNARAQLVTNRAFIISEMVTWMTANAPAYVALSAANKLLCQRDIGYAIDALAYDVNYGGNLATRNFARSLFNNITGVSIQPLGEATDSAASYTQLGAICAQIVRETYAGQDTSGTAASATEATRMTTLAGNIASVITAGNLSGLVAESAPSISWVSAGIQTAVGTLSTDKTTLIAETLQYISDSYNSFTYNHAKCSRDVATILKAVGYDFMFDANYQTVKSAYSYLRATASEVFNLGQKTVTRDALEYVRTQAIANVGADATAIARINTLMQALDDIIYSGSTEGSVCQTELRNADYAALQLERNRDFIIAEISAWMNYNYVNFDDYYDSATCARDIGYIIDAVVSDLATGSNFASSVAGESYYRIQAALVPGAQLMQTVAAVKEAKRLTAGYVTHSSQYTAVNAAFDNVIAILSGGLTAVPTYTWPDNGTSTTGAGGTVTDATALQTNRATMITGIETYLSTTSPYDAVWAALTTAQKNACKRDVGYMIDAITYDLQYGGNMQSTIAGSAYYSFGTLEIATGEKAATLAAITQLATLMQAYTSAGGDTLVSTLTGVIYNIINNGATEPMSYTRPSVSGEGANTQATHAAILADKTTIKTGVTTYITDTFSSYTYTVATCERDVGAFIDALKFDLKNPGNYKTLLAARLYANAVLGNTEEDMFYLRNGTGVRNMTLEGLQGDLTPVNAYGTRRVTAGAYCSLDPGWGPDDFRTWIISRSPYIQNVATFGYAAIGQKIDGALHNGGNQSMVSNDFTQLISDGIGAWVTNNGRAELVSVFTYYSHIGYLSENGGRIRGTNGNNSYGDFGSVAEGVDTTEVPNTAIVDNKAFKATVDVVNTDTTLMYNYEFGNAGSEYTEATWLVVGPGNFGSVEADEFRDDAVFEVRLLDNVDDSTNAPEADGNYGGFGYLTNSNTAQAGGASSITLATTDSELSTAYIGMKVTITGGSGVGKYAIIATYDSGTKVATVVKESTGAAGWDHTIPGYSNSNPDASSTYTIEPRVSFTAPTFASTAATLPTSGTWSVVEYAGTTAVYAAVSGSSTTSVSGTGATFTVTRNTSKYYVTVVSGGTNYERLDTITIPGTSLGGASTTNDITITVTSVNSVTGAVQAVDFEGYGVGGLYIALRSGSQVGATSVDGETWTTRTTLMPSGASWSDMATGILNDGSSTLKNSYMVAVAGGSANTTGAYSTDGITWTSTSMVTSATWVGVAFGEQRFVAIASDSTTVRISLDGINWDITGSLTTTGFTSITYGMGLFVAIKSGTNVTNYSTDGVTWTAGTLPSSSNWNSISWGNGRFVAISNTSGTVAAYSLDGVTWTASTLPATASWTKIAYGQGVFLAVSGSTQAATSEDGIVWTSRTMSTAANGFSAATFGNPNRYGRFVAVGGSTGTVASYVRFGAQTRARAYVADNKIFAIRIVEPGSGYASAPTMTITDPNNTYEAPFTVRLGKGALANPSFKNRGTDYVTASAEIDSGDGYADMYQYGSYIAVRQITARPVAGSNVVFENLPGTYKLVSIVTFLGEYDGDYTAYYQVSPTIKMIQAPTHGDGVTTRIRYSQVRLTGHDFLNIGYGNFDNSNYPGDPLPGYGLVQANECVENNGGRVFFTSTDQDGNFRVGDLFTIEQSTGVATLNADAFNIAGLQELSLGEVTLGGGSATVTEFSTDPFFTADSDSIVPTQRAIKAYIASQIGGGGASLIVNSVTSGSIVIATNQITTVTNETIQMNATFDFRGPVTGLPLAFNYFLT